MSVLVVIAVRIIVIYLMCVTLSFTLLSFVTPAALFALILVVAAVATNIFRRHLQVRRRRTMFGRGVARRGRTFASRHAG